MAIQFHVAHSAKIVGAGIFAGPPFYCAGGNVEVALNACMKDPGLISMDALYTATEYAAVADTIDDTSNLSKDKVWIFSGSKDTVVAPGVVSKTNEYYTHYLADSNPPMFNSTLPAEHAWITDTYGKECSFLGDPFINNCGFDSVGAMLDHILPGSLNKRGSANESSLMRFDQARYTPPLILLDEISMGPDGYIYVPKACQGNRTLCRLHVAFHGCEQDLATIGTDFVAHTGLNEYAETNNLVILYPQVSRVDPLNPKGCFDWWGYSGIDYACKAGAQMATIANMVRAVTGSF